MTDILMPNLGFDTNSGKVVRWLKSPGERVQKGEAIAIVESDKADVELEAIAGGVLINRLVEAGEEVAVGAVIARVIAPDDTPLIAPSAMDDDDEGGSDPRRTMLSPVAQRLVLQHNIDLEHLEGTGVGGRITRRDVERHLATATEQIPAVKQDEMPLALPKVRRAAREMGIQLENVLAAGVQNPIRLADLQAYKDKSKTKELPEFFEDTAPPEPQPEAPSMPPPGITDTGEILLSRMRQTIGKRLSESMREAPHFYVTGEFDLEDTLYKLEQFPAPQPRLNDLVQYVTVQTLLKVPELNATYSDSRLYRHPDINLAIAVALKDGLITPVIPKAQHLSLQGLAAASHDLIRRARENSLQAQDLSAGTFTISNLGVISQVDHFTAVINPPQVGILAVGAIKQRPVVRQGGLHVRHTVHLTLSGDHRVVDGMSLGRFMAAFQAELDHFSR